MDTDIIDRINKVIEWSGLSQRAFGIKIGFSYATINNYLLRKRTTVDFELIEKILSTFVDINPTWLTTGCGNMLLETSNEAVPRMTSNMALIPLVSQYAYAGYLNGFGDNEYVDTLPLYPVPLDHNPTLDLYIAFEVKGDSMENGSEESLVEGDVLICRSIAKDYWKSKLHIDKWDFVIVHKEEGVIVKRIVKHDVENGIITVHSLNPFYKDREIHLKDVAQLFNVVKSVRSKRR